MIMLKTITPIDNSIYVEREYAAPQEIENSLTQSKKSFHDWRQTPLIERKIILTKIPKIVKGNYDLVLLHPQSLSIKETKNDLIQLKKHLKKKKTFFIYIIKQIN